MITKSPLNFGGATDGNRVATSMSGTEPGMRGGGLSDGFGATAETSRSHDQKEDAPLHPANGARAGSNATNVIVPASCGASTTTGDASSWSRAVPRRTVHR